MEDVSVMDSDRETSGKRLDPTRLPCDDLSSGLARLPASEAERTSITPSRDQGQGHVMEKTNLTNDSVSTSEETFSTGSGTNRERLQPDGESALQNLGIGQT